MNFNVWKGNPSNPTTLQAALSEQNEFERLQSARSTFRSSTNQTKTRLVRCPGLANDLGVGSLFVKDEGRFPRWDAGIQGFTNTDMRVGHKMSGIDGIYRMYHKCRAFLSHSHVRIYRCIVCPGPTPTKGTNPNRLYNDGWESRVGTR